MTLPNISWDQVTTAAWIKWRPEVINQNFTSHPLYALIMEQGGIVERESTGGMSFTVQVKAGFSTQTRAFAGLATFDVQRETYKEPAEFYWKNIGHPMIVADEDLKIVSGAPLGSTVDLLADEFEFALEGMKNYFNTRLHEDGTAENGLTITGIAAPVSETPTSDTYGGLARSSRTWWQNYARTSCGSFATNGIGGSSTDYFMIALNAITDGTERPDVILMAQDVYEYYERQVFNTGGTNPIYMLQNNKLADLGFITLEYKGIPVVMDKQMEDGYIYMFNTKHWKLYVDKEWNFMPTGWSKLGPLTLGQANLILWRGELVCKRPNLQAVLSGWTA